MMLAFQRTSASSASRTRGLTPPPVYPYRTLTRSLVFFLFEVVVFFAFDDFLFLLGLFFLLFVVTKLNVLGIFFREKFFDKSPSTVRGFKVCRDLVTAVFKKPLLHLVYGIAVSLQRISNIGLLDHELAPSTDSLEKVCTETVATKLEMRAQFNDVQPEPWQNDGTEPRRHRPLDAHGGDYHEG